MAAIEQGFQKAEIERSAYQVAQEIDDGERVVVGVNRFAVDEEEPYEPLRVDPAIEADQRERLAAPARATATAAAVERALDELRRPPPGHRQRAATRCARRCAAEATVGEVCNALRDVWGTYVPARPLLTARSVRQSVNARR